MSITPYVPPSFLTGLPSAIWSGTQGLPVLPFLPGQDIAVSKAPAWSTGRVQSASGRVRKTDYWPFPLWNFELKYNVVRHQPPTKAELAIMWEFFNVMKGQYGTFLFVDPTDCAIPTSALLNPATGAPLLNPVTGQPLTDPGSSYALSYQFATGDGSTTTFQLSRSINSFAEPVYDVYEPTILDNGTITTATLTYSPNGKVTFGTAPAAGHALSWFGYYYFGCEFLQDDLTFEQIVLELWSGKSLKFRSLRA